MTTSTPGSIAEVKHDLSSRSHRQTHPPPRHQHPHPRVRLTRIRKYRPSRHTRRQKFPKPLRTSAIPRLRTRGRTLTHLPSTPRTRRSSKIRRFPQQIERTRKWQLLPRQRLSKRKSILHQRRSRRHGQKLRTTQSTTSLSRSSRKSGRNWSIWRTIIPKERSRLPLHSTISLGKNRSRSPTTQKNALGPSKRRTPLFPRKCCCLLSRGLHILMPCPTNYLYRSIKKQRIASVEIHIFSAKFYWTA